jgi:hypothetical protein
MMTKKLFAWTLIGLSIATLAACSNAQLATVSADATKTVAYGQLFCAKATASGPLIVQVADQLGAPISVVNREAKNVADICNVINAIPVSPPPAPALAPTVSIVMPVTAP